MRASASLLVFATALTSFSGVSGSAIPHHPPPTENHHLVHEPHGPPMPIGPLPVNPPTGALGKSHLRHVNPRHTTNDPNRDTGLPRDTANSNKEIPDPDIVDPAQVHWDTQPGKHAGPEITWPKKLHPEEVKN